MTAPWGLIAALAGLFALSGLFSGSETALFSIPLHRLRRMSRSERPDERAVSRAMEHPRGMLVTILIGNMIVNILASAMVSSAVLKMTGGSGWALVATTVAMTFLLLVLGEIAPKTVAYHHAEPIARFVARPLILLGKVLMPVRWPLVYLTNRILGEETDSSGTVEIGEVDTMVTMAHEEGEVDDEERDILLGVIELGNSPLEDVMTPRTEVFSLPGDLTVRDARDQVRESGFSKIPVSTAAPDEMAGYVTAMDLLLADDDQWVGSLSTPAEYVPEVKPAVDLLSDFQTSGRRIAFVVDEHGHLSGLVTLTDLLEEISGEMVESGDLHKVLYERVDKNRVIVPGRMELRFFNEEFGTELATEDSETLAGLVLERTGRIPEAGNSFVIDRLGVTILKAEPHRIVTVEIVFPEPMDEAEEPS